MKRYLLLLAVALAAAALGLMARLPRRESAQAKARPAVPIVVLEIAIVGDGMVSPELSAVPKDHRVQLRITNRSARAARIGLSGYEDRASIGMLAPGAAWQGEFLADRPGEDFAWLVDGQPTGRFRVLGPHLVDGHR